MEVPLGSAGVAVCGGVVLQAVLGVLWFGTLLAPARPGLGGRSGRALITVTTSGIAAYGCAHQPFDPRFFP